jgi:hypothetical protein
VHSFDHTLHSNFTANVLSVITVVLLACVERAAHSRTGQQHDRKHRSGILRASRVSLQSN